MTGGPFKVFALACIGVVRYPVLFVKIMTVHKLKQIVEELEESIEEYEL